MRNVYAVQFQIQPEPQADATWTNLLTTASAWTRSWYQRRGVDLEVSGSAQELHPVDGHSLLVTSGIAASGEKVWSMSWAYPADDDPSMLWQSHFTVASAGGGLEASLVLRVGSRSYRVAPPSFRLRRPNLVKTLFDGFECSLGSRRITTKAIGVTASETEKMVADLRAADRRLPLLVVSREPYSDRPLLDVDGIADQIAGLAHVRVFADKWASFKFTNLVGKQHSCFNGAVRLYWPTTNAEGEIRSDRHFMPEEVRTEGALVGERLLRRLAAASAFRFVEMDLTRTARAAVEQDVQEQQRRAQERALAEAGDRSELEALVNGLLEDKAKVIRELKQSRDDADVLRLELAEQQEKLAELESVQRDLKRTIGVVHVATPEAVDDAKTTDEDVEPTTVLEAVDEAATRFAGRLDIWSTARESAESSDFSRPTEVFQALWAVHDVADIYFASREAGKPMGRWADAFEERGLKFAPQETVATMNQYGQERTFTHNGVKRRIEKHLTLGGGDKKNCLQIYFDADDVSGRFVVAYCGRHLRTDKYQ